ncbi:hypothetical protein [Nostoc sp. CCY0012]|uniref:hypothetical protein n=1 Tax=Nostoc sp. CCY0012 TaxID=1056123 RepID=UPI0039C5BFA3
MFLLTPAKAAVYVPNCNFDIEDQSYYKLNLAYTTYKNINLIQQCKYLVWKKQINPDNILLNFFLIHHIEPINENEHRLFLQKYQQINHQSKIRLFFDIFKLENVGRQLIIDLNNLNINHQIFSTNYQPFITAIPVDTSFLPIHDKSSNEIIRTISEKLRFSLNQHDKFELKNIQAIIFNNKEITDQELRFIVKKGVEYSVEYINSEKIWINLKYTNFSRTIQPVKQLDLEEPINYKEHKLVNIRTGRSVPKKVKYISDIRDIENVFDTFDSCEAFDKRCDNLRFSQKKFWFEQTNIEDTVDLINNLDAVVDKKLKIIQFSDINQIQYKYKIIHKFRKYIFSNGELHHTPAKGLHHSGVFRMPKDMTLKVLVSVQKLETESLTKIIHNINNRIKFLYKNFVPLITEYDIITFDYNNFNSVFFKDEIQKLQSSYLLHLFDIKDFQSNFIYMQLIDNTNKSIIDVFKKQKLKFDIVNTFQEIILANSLLKIGVRNRAIPWKINQIDIQDQNHLFVGIDLGHNHKDKFSNLTLTAIDNNGCLIRTYTIKKLANNESISYQELFKYFQYILNLSTNQYQGITIHRDGKFQEDVESYHRVMREIGIQKYNLVEVTKSGNPLIGFYSNIQEQTTYLDGFEGYYIFTDEISYLITNDQALNTKTAPNPLKIRKIYGYKKVTEITEEIYWLTKAYSINIFEPTKLPITTLIANNLAYSRNLIHFTKE